MNLSEKQKMLAGELYQANDPQLVAERLHAKELCHRYNQEPVHLNKQVLAELLGYETDAHLEAPLRCDYGYNIRLGQNVYANYNLTILDCAPVTIGNTVWLGAGALVMPGVSIGENTTIGAGSVVTRDIPANSVAVGNPCRVIRELEA